MSGSFKKLTIERRRRIERWVNAKVPVLVMAPVLKRPKYAGYYGAAAQLKADGRSARHISLIKHSDFAKDVVQRLKYGWTPEQAHEAGHGQNHESHRRYAPHGAQVDHI